MKNTFLFTIITVSLGLVAACSPSATPPAPANTTTTAANQTSANANSAGTESHAKSDDEIPASVKAVFPEAQTFTMQHKDIPANKIASIEKDTGGKIPDKDHHSYLAFANKDGKRTQIGAATMIKADGKDLTIVYESKNGMPTIKEVRADGIAKEFLAQFAGKNHDSKVVFGEDIKAGGADENVAKAITQAVRIDLLTMEALYGSAHTH